MRTQVPEGREEQVVLPQPLEKVEDSGSGEEASGSEEGPGPGVDEAIEIGVEERR